MENNQCEEQSNKLRSRNKRVCYYRNGVTNLKNRISRMKPIVKKKHTGNGLLKKKSFIANLCHECKRTFKNTDQLKIHEKHGCSNGKRNESLTFNYSTSNDQVDFVTLINDSEPKIRLTRLTPEELEKYSLKIHSSDKQAPGILKNSSSNSLRESHTTEDTVNNSSLKGLIEECPALNLNSVRQTALRHSPRLATTVAKVCSEDFEHPNTETFSKLSETETDDDDKSNDANSLQQTRTASENSIFESMENTVFEEPIVTRGKEAEEMNYEIQPTFPNSEILAEEAHDKNLSDVSRSKLPPKSESNTPVGNMPIMKLYSCKFCCSAFSCRQILLSHIATHPESKNNRYCCSLCENTYNRKQNLHSHVLTQHTSLRPYSCSCCGNSFAIKAYLMRHIKSCPAQYSSSQVIPKESERFSGQNYSKIGEKSPNTEIAELRCPLCTSVCKSQSALVSHMMHHRIAPVNGDEAEGQHEGFNSTEGNSQRDTDVQQKYLCSICAKEFSTYQRLETHERKHKMTTQNQPLKNDAIPNDSEAIDGGANVYIGAPRRKRKSFHGIFKCSSCDYSTKYFGSLNKHELQVHNRVTVSKNTVSLPNFIHCQLCNYATRYKCNMSSHQKRIHGANNKFSCKHCSFSTERAPDWKEHQLRAHNVRPISTCKKCNFVFASYNELKCHRMKHLRENTSCDANLQPLAPEVISADEEIKDDTESEADCVVVEEGKLLHACNLCGKKFARKHFLEKHIKCVHFAKTTSLTNPNQKEKSPLPFSEITVPKSAKSQSKANSDTHYQCMLCLVVCVSASALEKHLNRHRV